MSLSEVPIARRVLRFHCPFCGRGSSKRIAATLHIRRCYKNPAARGCKTCVYFEPGERAEPISGYPGCPEMCGNGHQLAPSLRVGCPDWSDQP